MLTLAIETSGPVGSVAVIEAGKVLGEETLELGRQHGQSLIPTIRRLLDDCEKEARDFELVAVSVGPGSYTGLRVGVVFAKTFAYVVNCRLAAVDTLHAIACNSPVDVAIVEVICDAQRGDLFTGTYARDNRGDWARRGSVEIVAAELWAKGLKSQDVVSGPAVEKLASLVEGRCRVLAPEFRLPRAAWMGRLGIQAVEQGRSTDLWSVEPLYLRRSSAEVQWEKLHPGRYDS